MRPEEVINILQDLDIKTDIRSLQRYAKQDLITKPNTVSAGRNHGRIADYADDTVSQVKALKATQGLLGKIRQKNIVKIRKIALIKQHLIQKGYAYLHAKDIIQLCKDRGLPEPNINRDEEYNFIDYYLGKEIEALNHIPEDIKKVIDLLVTNWIIAYSATEEYMKERNSKDKSSDLMKQVMQKNNMSSIEEIESEWYSLMNSVTSIYSSERIDKALKYLDNMNL